MNLKNYTDMQWISAPKQKGEKMAKDEYTRNGWTYALPTPVVIDGELHTIQMAEGMTGICSRAWFVDGKSRFDSINIVTQSADLTKGNHFLYLIKWRDTPWDRVYILIHEDELPMLLSEENKWREPQKIDLSSMPTLRAER